MTALRVLAARVAGFLRRGRSESDLDEDIQAHLDLLTDDYLARGMAPHEARAAARRAFGGVEQMKESWRDQRGLPFFEGLFQDLRHAVRALRHSPAFTLVAVVTIALGVFGPTVSFAMVKAWILDPLPFAQPDQLVDLRVLNTRTGNTEGISAADFLDWQRETHAFAGFAGYRQSDVRFTGGDHAEHVRGAQVTPGFFALLGAQPRVGRLFDPSETDEAQARRVVIGHLMWKERLHEDPNPVGRTLRLNGEDYEVIGVLPADFQFTLLGRCDVWRVLAFTPVEAENRKDRALVAVARLARGRTLVEARHELEQAAARLAASQPDTNARRGVRVWRLADEVRQHHDLGFIVPVMFAMCGCILLIACVNVTNVMLARISTRRQEMAVRLALGASRGRIVRQWLVEQVLLFVGASALGALLTVYGADWITNSIAVENRQYLRNYAVLPVDRTVVMFALATGALCGLLFGWLAARLGSKADVNADLRDASARATPGRAGTRLRASLAISEVALALAVLISSGLLVKTAENITRVDVGFEPQRLLTLQLGLDAGQYRTPAEIRGFYDRLLDDLRGRPGVSGVAAASLVPFGDNGNRAELFPLGAPETPPAETQPVTLSQISADYPSVMRLRLAQGRFLDASDGAEAPKVALINETLAARQFAGGNPIGRRFRLGRGSSELWTVVGVVKDVKNYETIDPPDPQAYVPFAQQPRRGLTLVLRSNEPPEALIGAARAAVAEIDPAEPIANVASMEERILRQTNPFVTIATFVKFFGAVTLLLAGVGVYGVVSYGFAQRTREIGVRMALGARRIDVAKLVWRQLRTFLLAALVPGMLLAWALCNALRAMLFGVTPTDWRSYVGMSLLLGAVALLAAFIPARRAMTIDPVTALRQD